MYINILCINVMCVHICVYLYTYMYTYIYIYTNIYIHIIYNIMQVRPCRVHKNTYRCRVITTCVGKHVSGATSGTFVLFSVQLEGLKKQSHSFKVGQMVHSE